MYIKWTITKIRETSNYLQVADFHIFDINGDKIKPRAVTTNMEGIIDENIKDESIKNIIDNIPKTKYCTGHWGNTQTNTCEIIFEVNRINVCTYDYVTANDYPDRDPISWTISVSEDGVNWTLKHEVNDANITTARNTITQTFSIYHYERKCWGITDHGLINTAAPEVPELMETSAPNNIWRPIDKTIETEEEIIIGAELEHLLYPEVPELMETSSPIGMWRIDKTNTLSNGLDEVHIGACCFASSLESTTIPQSCKAIGRESFSNTSLTEINLSDDCTYYSTSFPRGCVIHGGTLIE